MKRKSEVEAHSPRANKKTCREPTTILSLPRELRQQIFLLAVKPAYLDEYDHLQSNSDDLTVKVEALIAGLAHLDLTMDIDYAAREWAKEIIRIEGEELEEHPDVSEFEYEEYLRPYMMRLEKYGRAIQDWNKGGREYIFSGKFLVNSTSIEYPTGRTIRW